jgi:hypothetical protein
VLGDQSDREAPDFAERAEKFARELEEGQASIHAHTFTAASFLRLLLECREHLHRAFEIEAFARNEAEAVAVVRKTGAEPTPAAPAATAPGLASQVDRLGTRLAQLERELRQLKASSSWRVTEPLRAARARLGRRR